MRKKWLSLLAIAVLSLSVAACGGKDAEKTDASSNVEEKDVASVETEEESEVEYASKIPVPEDIFKNGTINVTDPDGGETYMFEVTGYSDDEFSSYISQCKTLGFDDISYETDTDFGAYTSDGAYWVQVNLDAEEGKIYVICQMSKHEK